MIKLTNLTILFSVLTLLFSSSIYAEGYIKKEVYSFKDAQGNVVFTDKKPNKQKSFRTQTIEAAGSTGNSQNVDSVQYRNTVNNEHDYKNITQTVRIVVDRDLTTKKKSKKKKSLKRCKAYKKKFTYYSDKMKAGYKNSEFKKLDSNRKKYKNLLFENCPTKTFSN